MPVKIIAGVDEVGRGCIVGPVIAAAVILNPERAITGLTDSKKLTEKKREQLTEIIKKQALAWAIGRAEPSEIDQINILQASLLAMQRAVVYRDREMAVLDALYPGYEFSKHKGYPTKLHKEKLTELGICKQHRRSFAPVKLML